MFANQLPLRLFLAVLLGLTFAPVANAASVDTWPIDWQVQSQRDHALIGRIWQPEGNQWAAPDQLRAALAKADFVVLGETHDNPDHHRLQAQLLAAMVAADRKPVVAFEMLDASQQPALQRYLQSPDAAPGGLGKAVGWSGTGWPDWSIYQPIAEVAMNHHLTIVAANLPADKVKEVARKGFSALSPQQVSRLGLDKPLADAWRDIMLDELYAGHCKLMPRAALGGMVKAQRSRNASMAQRMLESNAGQGVVLIAGAGHARTDFGVPMRLSQSGSVVLSVAMIEVTDDQTQATAYAANYGVDKLPFDYVVFTPAAPREDPCERLRKRFAAHAPSDEPATAASSDN